MALEAYEDSLCGCGCGFPADISHDPANKTAFGPREVTCYALAARERDAEDHKGESARGHGVMVAIVQGKKKRKRRKKAES